MLTNVHCGVRASVPNINISIWVLELSRDCRRAFDNPADGNIDIRSTPLYICVYVYRLRESLTNAHSCRLDDSYCLRDSFKYVMRRAIEYNVRFKHIGLVGIQPGGSSSSRAL